MPLSGYAKHSNPIAIQMARAGLIMPTHSPQYRQLLTCKSVMDTTQCPDNEDGEWEDTLTPETTSGTGPGRAMTRRTAPIRTRATSTGENDAGEEEGGTMNR